MIRESQTGDTTYLPDAKWTVTAPLVVFVAGLFGSAVGIVVAVSMGASEFGEVAVGLLAQALAALGLLSYLSTRFGSGDWSRDYGLRIEPRHVVWLGAGFVLQVTVALLVGPLIEWLAPDDPPQQGIADIAESLEGSLQTLVFMVLVVLVAPLVEEIIFRGMLLARLRRSLGQWGAITASAAVFAAIHLVDPSAIYAVPGLFLVGMALGWAALRHGDLSVPIFIHAGVNLTGVIVLIYAEELLESVEALALLIP